GTCGQALSDSSVSALTNRTEKVDLNVLSGREACEKLQRDFLDNLDSACFAFAPGDRWTGITAKVESLSGKESPEPIFRRQNKTSKCWPVLPKSDDLTLCIAPILTIFFPGDGDDNLVSETTAQLTCVKAIDLTTAINETQSPKDGDGDSAAGRLSDSGRLAIWVSMMSIVFVLLGY
ncbi:uncharacterized protein P884DRAFT_200480, partial [Thermothelomyces heterothallicus CBS 202.75]|uniref:uncharacterized protein n=1 Tax=Thermothelomyces heterothallicus CBS 202.75 TaxID=1149848 RepID=UPI00374257DF